jgi:hypothetical protein
MGGTWKKKLPLIAVVMILGILLFTACPVVGKIINGDYGVYGQSKYSGAEYAPVDLKK